MKPWRIEWAKGFVIGSIWLAGTALWAWLFHDSVVTVSGLLGTAAAGLVLSFVVGGRWWRSIKPD